MSDDAAPDFQKLSAEEVADVAEGMYEFHSVRAWKVLGQITGLQTEEGWVEEQLTDRKPPREVAPDDEIIAIDECLGRYQPKAKRIILFQRGIAAAADALRREAEDLENLQKDLEHVVRYHEWGHAILHVGLDKGRHQCELRDYNRIDKRVHESIVQLLAWHAIEANIRKSRNPRARDTWNRIKEVFIRLEHRQPPPYRSWRQFEKLPILFLQEILVLVRKQIRFADWEGLSVLNHEWSEDDRTT